MSNRRPSAPALPHPSGHRTAEGLLGGGAIPEETIQKLLGLALKHARKVARRWRYPDVAELAQIGLLAALERAGFYRAGERTSFEAFVSRRMRGAMIEHCRTESWLAALREEVGDDRDECDGAVASAMAERRYGEEGEEEHDDAAAAWAGLGGLDELRRSVIVAHVVEGVRVTDCARRLGVAHHRARYALEAGLAQLGAGAGLGWDAAGFGSGQVGERASARWFDARSHRERAAGDHRAGTGRRREDRRRGVRPLERGLLAPPREGRARRRGAHREQRPQDQRWVAKAAVMGRSSPSMSEAALSHLQHRRPLVDPRFRAPSREPFSAYAPNMIASSAFSGSQLQLLVELQDIEPRIWRRLVVPADAPLDILHDILQVAFGWKNCHLHDFHVGDVRFGIADVDDELLAVDERAAPLGAIARQGSSFVYRYDFGDDWAHGIRVEAVAEPDRKPLLWECLGGARACPPEDCGGVSGYEKLLRVLRDPAHEEYADTRRWVGRGFDAEKFEVDPVNKKLATIGRKFAQVRRALARNR